MFKCNLSQIQIRPYTPWRPQITQTTNCFIGCLENQMPSLDPYTAYIFYSIMKLPFQLSVLVFQNHIVENLQDYLKV